MENGEDPIHELFSNVVKRLWTLSLQCLCNYISFTSIYYIWVSLFIIWFNSIFSGCKHVCWFLKSSRVPGSLPILLNGWNDMKNKNSEEVGRSRVRSRGAGPSLQKETLLPLYWRQGWKHRWRRTLLNLPSHGLYSVKEELKCRHFCACVYMYSWEGRALIFFWKLLEATSWKFSLLLLLGICWLFSILFTSRHSPPCVLGMSSHTGRCFLASFFSSKKKHCFPPSLMLLHRELILEFSFTFATTVFPTPHTLKFSSKKRGGKDAF